MKLRIYCFGEGCMSRLLEILGRAITVDTADLIWQWFTVAGLANEAAADSAQAKQFDKIIEVMGNMQDDIVEKQLHFYLFENPSCTYGRLTAAAICIHNGRIPIGHRAMPNPHEPAHEFDHEPGYPPFAADWLDIAAR